jgi:hypothetical protein
MLSIIYAECRLAECRGAKIKDVILTLNILIAQKKCQTCLLHFTVLKIRNGLKMIRSFYSYSHRENRLKVNLPLFRRNCRRVGTCGGRRRRQRRH